MFGLNDLFGWRFSRKDKGEEYDDGGTNANIIEVPMPHVERVNDDAAFVIGSTAYSSQHHHINLDNTFASEADLIRKYRQVALLPETDAAITDIVNEAIDGSEGQPVDIVLDDLKYTETIKAQIRKEFDNVLGLLNFNSTSYETFRKWYVDGRLYYNVVIDPKDTEAGIKELRYMSPLTVKKIREEKRTINKKGLEVVAGYEEFYLYSKTMNQTKGNTTGIKLTPDSVVFVNSGLVDEDKNTVYSYLHKAIKPSNQLKMLEDAVIIYRLARAPERRVFYVDVGRLPTKQAEQYVRGIMRQYQNKLSYDAVTGEVKDQTETLSMLEDFWMPRKEGGRGTEITTLPGGQTLGQMEDVEYFKKKLYMALGVPYSRVSQEANSMFALGRTSEISRDEIKFTKFISRLRKRFSQVFFELLKRQLILKKIISPQDWDYIESNIYFNFKTDTYFSEFKDAEMLRERLSTLRDVEDYVGKYFSKDYVRRNVLRMTEEEIEEEDKKMEKEKAEEPEEPMDNAFGSTDQGFDQGQEAAGEQPPQFK